MPPAVGQTLSPAEFAKVNGSFAPTNPTPTNNGGFPAVGETVSPDQFKNMNPQAPQFGDPTAGISDVFNKLGNWAGNEVASSWVDSWNDIVKNVKTATSQTGQPASPAQGIHLVSDIGNIAMAPFGTIANIFTGGGLSKVINMGGEALANNPVVQRVADFFGKHPDAEQVIFKDLPTLLNMAAMGAGGEKVAPELENPLKTNPTEPTPTTPQEVTLPSGAKTDAATADALAKVSDEWRSPTAMNKPGFKIPTGILEKSPDVPNFLAEQGLNPFEHIDENGRYETLDTANALRENAGASSNSTMRAALKVADYTTPKTVVNDLQSDAEKYAANGYNVTASDLEAVNKNIQDEVASLQRKYPKGMSLEDMHDERITYGKNGKFSPVGDKNVTNSARANRAMADSLSNMIQAKAPPEVGYQGYQKYISNFYKSAEYLESLNAKKAPVSFGQKLARTAAKVGMAKLFELLPGGGVIDTFIGYEVGKVLERLVENLTMPQRNAFLKELKISDPEAYTKVTEFLKKETAASSERKALPAPKEKGTAENPHIMSTNQLRPEEKQTSGEMIKEKYTYNPVDKKYYLKGARGGNPPKK